MGALAIGSPDPTVATGMGERKPPPIAPTPLQSICEKWNRKPFALQDGAHKAIEAVRDDGHDHALARAEAHESDGIRGLPGHCEFPRRALRVSRARALLGAACTRARISARLATRPRYRAKSDRQSAQRGGRLDRRARRCHRSRREHDTSREHSTTAQGALGNDAALTWRALGSAALQARWSPIVHVAILMPTCQRPRPGKSIRNQAEDLHIDALYRRSGVPRGPIHPNGRQPMSREAHRRTRGKPVDFRGRSRWRHRRGS